jgi:hypothetical protein
LPFGAIRLLLEESAGESLAIKTLGSLGGSFMITPGIDNCETRNAVEYV